MGFRKDFLWGGATAANQCEGGANEGNRGVANVDLMPLGEDRYLVGTGKMKMYDLVDEDDFDLYEDELNKIKEIFKPVYGYDFLYHNIGLDDFGGVVLIDYGETEKLSAKSL